MKSKISIIICAFFLLATLLSCNKRYDCNCITASGETEVTEIKAKSKEDARSNCEARASGAYSSCALQ